MSGYYYLTKPTPDLMPPSILTLPPGRAHNAVVNLPGSKSISNRALLLAALADNSCRLHNLLAADDSRYMQAALAALGVKITGETATVAVVSGCGGIFPVRRAELFLGNAGTALRPLTAVLALQPGHYVIDGTPRMRERPIKDLVDSLQALGAQLGYQGDIGFPPLTVAPFHDNGADAVKIRAAVSSQFLSALLMALPLLHRDIKIELTGEVISRPYIALTLNLMASFGVQVSNHNFTEFWLAKGQKYSSPADYIIEGDASGASYFFAAAFLSAAAVTVNGIGGQSPQGDLRFAHELVKLGAKLSCTPDSVTLTGPESGGLPAFTVDARDIPDAAMTFCILALKAQGTSLITNIGSWRVKETDRIEAMRRELTKLGAQVVTTAAGIAITPPAVLTADVLIDTYDDHRMAMCFALIALLGVPVRINDPDCVNKTFPDFFSTFRKIYTPDITDRNYLSNPPPIG